MSKGHGKQPRETLACRVRIGGRYIEKGALVEITEAPKLDARGDHGIRYATVRLMQPLKMECATPADVLSLRRYVEDCMAVLGWYGALVPAFALEPLTPAARDMLEVRE